MNCTRLLHAFGSHPQPAVMPVDLAMCWSLSQQQPLHQLLATSPLKPPQLCSLPRTIPFSLRHSSTSSSSASSSSASSLPSSPLNRGLRSCFRRDGSGANKKHVVFADDKGLALTAVHLFTPERLFASSTLHVKSSAAKLQIPKSASNAPQRYKLCLGFPPPALDIKGFLARLRETHVQLESCNISEHSLSGIVCVSHISNENAVHIRVTFDSWRSQRDIPCMFLQQLRLAGFDLDVYAFDFALPQNIDPKERIEFCASLRPGLGATPHWDDNRGLNYRVCVEKDRMNCNQGDANRHHPTPQSGLSHFQRTFSSRVTGVKHFNQGPVKLAYSFSAAEPESCK